MWYPTHARFFCRVCSSSQELATTFETNALLPEMFVTSSFVSCRRLNILSNGPLSWGRTRLFVAPKLLYYHYWCAKSTWTGTDNKSSFIPEFGLCPWMAKAHFQPKLWIAHASRYTLSFHETNLITSWLTHAYPVCCMIHNSYFQC